MNQAPAMVGKSGASRAGDAGNYSRLCKLAATASSGTEVMTTACAFAAAVAAPSGAGVCARHGELHNSASRSAGNGWSWIVFIELSAFKKAQRYQAEYETRTKSYALFLYDF
ncbi:hypothetical protein [Rugamonas sp.]|uniref:hypothetical protein n=1 Tax=Rugamonas sp. TaxID=1926287 RepID=UPI0025EFB2F1|nr:hypothetical protein [Rugamonas sp.]